MAQKTQQKSYSNPSDKSRQGNAFGGCEPAHNKKSKSYFGHVPKEFRQVVLLLLSANDSHDQIVQALGSCIKLGRTNDDLERNTVGLGEKRMDKTIRTRFRGSHSDNRKSKIQNLKLKGAGGQGNQMKKGKRKKRKRQK